MRPTLLLALLLLATLRLPAKDRVVFLIGEDEYRTWETLPEFARSDAEPRGLDVRVIQQDPAEKHRFPGLREALRDADLLLVSVRRRALPKPDLDAIRAHVAAGRPLVGIRTASHAFAPRAQDAGLGDSWVSFDPEVLGGHYHGHHGSGPRVEFETAPGAATHPILAGIDPRAFKSAGSLYVVSPLESAAVPLLIGRIPGKPAEPVAWTHASGPAKARVFYTSLGHPDDFKEPAFRRLLLNGMFWAMNRPIPAAVPPLSPAESARRFTVIDGLELELVLAEPDIAQPLHITFDERGRLWLAEYRQYPAPAGLTLVSHDQFWRAVYDRVPPPPPRHFPGRDRISIHEDSDGDGSYDRHSVFVDGLNIATASAPGRGGVWILNPPYLLFYPDRNHDDVPDGDPEVHLEGFGLEDTHSVVNSLRWGPDGWLYAAQGSTVSGRVRHPGSTNAPVHILGQNIWRYHPERRRFEIFSEGGGNAFGVEIDDAGRIFSGHNGGNTRGFHYVQGGYLQKGFEKHGQLSNPYAFGYFPQMAHQDVERFTHTFLVYGGGALSAQFDGRLFGIEPLQGRVVLSELSPDASTFRTRDLGYAVTSADPWFKPVDLKHGPDGAIYIADWYDFQVNHWRNYQGNMDAGNGRVYRLKAKGSKSTRPEDLGRVPTSRLVDLLANPNRWIRQTALRLLGDRRDPTAIPALRPLLGDGSGQIALEALWGLHLSGGFDESTVRTALSHRTPVVREWAVRLLGDSGSVRGPQFQQLLELAAREPDLAVRQQLAASARRLPADQTLRLVSALLAHDADTRDPRQPLMLWWAVEAKADDRPRILDWLDQPGLVDRPLVRDHLLERLMRRYALAGTPSDLDQCAALLARAPNPTAAAPLLAGFEKGFEGRTLAGLPAPLLAALANAGGGSLALQLRTGRDGALDRALALLQDAKAKAGEKVQVLQTLGELKLATAVPALLAATESGPDATRIAALAALQTFPQANIAPRVLASIPAAPAAVRTAALNLLAGRAAWAVALVDAVENQALPPDLVGPDIARQLKRHAGAGLDARVAKVWPKSGQPSSAEMEASITRLAAIVRDGHGDPYNGKKLFTSACASCHKLFHVGGSIGPDLTPYRRDDLDTLLLNIVNPSAEIREGYEQYLVETRDERSLGGFIVRQDPQLVVLRGLDGQDVALPRGEISELRPAGLSLMPEALLDTLDPQQIRDFFAYLRSSQPLAN